MGTLFIVACSEGVEGPLLAHSTRFGWVSRILLQRPVKSLQSPILLLVTWLDTLRRDSQLDPPYRQSRGVPQGRRWQMATPLSVRIVQGRPYSLNTPWSARRTCGPVGRVRPLHARRYQRDAGILDRQRVYAHPVSRAEPTLEPCTTRRWHQWPL